MFVPLPKGLGRVLATSAVVLLASAPAVAHIDLLEPEARAHGTAARGDTQIDENSNLKSGPCGQVTSGRTARVARYAPGQTITVRVREENAHVSYLRVAIDLDGESFPLRTEVPPAAETQEEASAAEAALGNAGLLAVLREDNDTAGFVHEIAVTLPEVSCERCTLQVMQHMYDDLAAPHYFQCADLVIAAAGGAPDAGPPAPDADLGAGTSAGTPGGSTPGASAPEASAGGAPIGARPTAGSGASEVAGSAAAGPAMPVAAVPTGEGESAGDGGCSLSSGPVGSGRRLLAGLMALGLTVLCRRRR